MGIRDYFSSANEKVKADIPTTLWDQKVKPDLTTFKSIYDLASYKIDHAVRVVAVGKLYHYWRDDQARTELTRFAADFTKNTCAYAIEESVKTVPGGVPLYKIFSKSLQSVGGRKFVDEDGKIKELVARIEKLEKRSCECTCRCNKNPYSGNNTTPEDSACPSA